MISDIPGRGGGGGGVKNGQIFADGLHGWPLSYAISIIMLSNYNIYGRGEGLGISS